MRKKQFLYLLFTLLCFGCQSTKTEQVDTLTLKVLSFNILQGAGNAANVGFTNERFNGSRVDEIIKIINATEANIVGIQEDASDDRILDALGEDWNRCKNVYAKFPMKFLKSGGPLLNACQISLPSGDSLIFVNTHWSPQGYGPFLVQDYLLKDSIPENPKDLEAIIFEATKKIIDGKRGYNETLNLLNPYLEKNQNIILVGDFNEPSHLDWTDRYAMSGPDRMIKNPTSTPLRFNIAWRGSKRLEAIGLIDAYRAHFTDEVTHPGNTWTPAYPNNTPGRRDHDMQVLDRIDRIYYAANDFEIKQAALVTDITGVGEIKVECNWPSDHWAVFVELISPSK